MQDVTRILIISSDKTLRDVLNFCFDGWGYKVFLRDSLACDMNFIKRISPNVIVVDVQSARKSQLEICHLLKNDFTTSFIPMITIINKSQLRQQLLNIRQGIDDYLIKPPDPLDLRIRIEMAIRRSQSSFHASPLTGLPGGRVIEEMLNDKMKGTSSFSFVYVDIDNFKCFNDTYGHLRGDRVLMQTAYMLYNTVKKFGNHKDFIGHVGGDDFVFMTIPDRYKQICRSFIQTFDKVIPFHYAHEDRKRGFIIAKDRARNIKEIPLMSLSIAVVSRTSTLGFKNVIEINERVAEIKSYLKSIPGSKFMAERRNLKPGDNQSPQFNEEKAKLTNSYRPLGHILIDKKIITPEQLDEALKVHWGRGVVLGDVLKELGMVNDEKLTEALKTQEATSSGAKSELENKNE